MNQTLIKLLAELGTQMLVSLIKTGIDELKERQDNSLDKDGAEALKNVIDIIEVSPLENVAENIAEKVTEKLTK